LALLAPVVAVACSSSPPKDDPEPKAGRVESPIINGQNDTTHQAVVFVYGQQGNQGAACSGTIVKTDPANKIGWVLTAAHCVTTPPVLIIQGNDINAANAIRYTVLDYQADSRYQGQGDYDFAVIRFVGADANTPVIPITGASDGLVSQSSVCTSVGYGTTVVPAQDNSVRHYVNKTVAYLDSTQIGYSQITSGICFGDSGGPVLFNNGGEKVVGIHSYVQGNCVSGSGAGYSARVSSGLGFINPQLSKAAPAASCDLCLKTQESGTQTCAVKQQQCFGDAQCKGYYDCLVACTTATCQSQCATKYPLGQGPLLAVSGCSCQQCNAECSGNSACFNVPKCGFAVFGSSCRTCTDTSCCNETRACAEDGQCYVCLKGGDKDPACANNPKRKAMLACQQNNCGTKCFSADGGVLDPDGGEPPPDGTQDDGGALGPGNGGTPVTTTTTTSGCSASPAAPAGSGAALLFAGALALGRRRRR
jgi:uncharacterized protein (TIGR03382 family)